MLSRTKNSWTNLFWKSSKINLVPVLSSQKWVASVAQWFLFPVSTVSARNAWGPNSPFVSYIRRRKMACRLWALLLTQVRLIRAWQAYTTFSSSQNVLCQNKFFLRHVDYALEGFMFCLMKWDFGSFFHTNKGSNFVNFIQSTPWIWITKQLVHECDVFLQCCIKVGQACCSFLCRM